MQNALSGWSGEPAAERGLGNTKQTGGGRLIPVGSLKRLVNEELLHFTQRRERFRKGEPLGRARLRSRMTGTGLPLVPLHVPDEVLNR